MTEVVSLKPELPKSSIVYTYIEGQFNLQFGQMTLTSTNASGGLIKLHFESFDVTSHFSALRLTYSWLPLGIYWFLKL